MHEKIFMNLRETDFSNRAQKGLDIQENTYELDIVKIKNCCSSKELHLKII